MERNEFLFTPAMTSFEPIPRFFSPLSRHSGEEEINPRLGQSFDTWSLSLSFSSRRTKHDQARKGTS